MCTCREYPFEEVIGIVNFYKPMPDSKVSIRVLIAGECAGVNFEVFSRLKGIAEKWCDHSFTETMD